MDATERISVDSSRVILTGDIDLSAVDSYTSETEIPTGISAIEAAGVTFIDSSGLKFLIDLISRSPHAILRNPSTRILELLSITGTADLFTTELARRPHASTQDN